MMADLYPARAHVCTSIMTTHSELTPPGALGNIIPISVSKYNSAGLQYKAVGRAAAWRSHLETAAVIFTEISVPGWRPSSLRGKCLQLVKEKDASGCLSTFKSSSVPAQQSKWNPQVAVLTVLVLYECMQPYIWTRRLGPARGLGIILGAASSLGLELRPEPNH